jgi:SAM-dependent methyltransferase
MIMDLRGKDLTPRQLQSLHEFIVKRTLNYQPFLFTDDLEVGAGQHFIQGAQNTNLVRWTTPDPRVRDLLTTEPELFTKSNAHLRSIYELMLDFITAQLKDIRGLSFAEIGCNTGYLLFGLALRGARRCLGFDYCPRQDVFATLNEILGTACEFQFGEWDSLSHELKPAPMPEVDVGLSVAVTCHLADPIHHLAYLCDHCRKAVFVWGPVTYEDRLVLSFGPLSKYASDLDWPLNFDAEVRFSVPLLRLSLAQAGFEEIHELEPPDSLPEEWKGWFRAQKGYFAVRTKDIRTAVTPGGGRRSRGLIPEATTSSSRAKLRHGKLWSIVRRALGKVRLPSKQPG